ncbi:AMP-binding protein [Brevibacillus ginsengisoli]|uniref:AMP-binding protein n=1 Tax=Brevibacillus ginsengisoli TaxID=363854 RepID=UPI003CE954CF
MNFWDLAQYHNSTMVVHHASNQSFSSGDILDQIQRFSLHLPSSHKSLGFILCRNCPTALVGYLAALQGKHAVCLLDSKLSWNLLQELMMTYQPEWIWLPQEIATPLNYTLHYEESQYKMLHLNSVAFHPPIHPDLAILLSTSGTTGSPKMVRLSYQNLQANAESISAYLELQADDRPITTLPLHYSYGLSVINSHLQVGASLLMTEDHLTQRSFWDFLQDQRATSIAGVPYQYQMLYRLHFDKMMIPSLRTLTQAGGRLDEKLQRYFADVAQNNHLRFYIMYGQTEATARISYVPHDQIQEGIGTIGIPIPDGKLELDEETSELIYYGSNVMMGYAYSRNDLSKTDEMNGKLMTGDIARQESNGFFSIIGRKKRFLKPLGLRVNLDDIELTAEKTLGIPCYCTGKDDQLIVVISDEALQSPMKQFLSQTYQLHPTVYKVVVQQDIPRLATGKVDYQTLLERVLK